MSSILSPRRVRTLQRIGDIMHPGGDGMPSFTESGCISRVDDVVGYLPGPDIADLSMLLGVLSLLPTFLLRFVVKACRPENRVPGAPGGLLRLIGLAFKGIVMSLYYADPGVLERLGYEVGVVTDDVVAPVTTT